MGESCVLLLGEDACLTTPHTVTTSWPLSLSSSARTTACITRHVPHVTHALHLPYVTHALHLPHVTHSLTCVPKKACARTG